MVAAGAMPRNALADLDSDLEKQRLQTELRTLTGKRELSLDEISSCSTPQNGCAI
ncbi:MAG: hypothetical protein R2724_24510 [Bryobacterales bacterium]